MDEDRIRHSLAVARKMVQIGQEYNLSKEELQDLFVLGFNHDIGYEFGDKANHEKIGGEILKRNNYKYWKEINYHGDSNSKYNSLFLFILNKADMQIDKYGNDKRLKDIENRYGNESITYKKAKIIVDKLRDDSNE